jgi:hypothetical protein
VRAQGYLNLRTRDAIGFVSDREKKSEKKLVRKRNTIKNNGKRPLFSFRCRRRLEEGGRTPPLRSLVFSLCPTWWYCRDKMTKSRGDIGREMDNLVADLCNGEVPLFITGAGYVLRPPHPRSRTRLLFVLLLYAIAVYLGYISSYSIQIFETKSMLGIALWLFINSTRLSPV